MPEIILTDGLRSHVALAGIKAIQFQMKVEAPGFGDQLILDAQARLQEKLFDLLHRGRIDASKEVTAPQLILFLSLRTARECNSGLYFHIYRVETVLREIVTVQRAAATMLTADTWSHRVTVGYEPLDMNGQTLEASIYRQCVRQIQGFIADFTGNGDADMDPESSKSEPNLKK